VLGGDPAPLWKGAQQLPHFSAHVYCGQTAGRIGIQLGTEERLGPGDTVLDGDQAGPPFTQSFTQPVGPLLWPASPQARILPITRTVD